MGTAIDDLKKECKYICLEIDNSGLEGFRCRNRNVIKKTGSSWCDPKNGDEPCSICEYCEPEREDMEMTIDEAIRRIDEHNYIHQGKEPRAIYITEAFDTLIDVAKKYQKITEIVEHWACCGNPSDSMIAISEVLEDGNDSKAINK